MSDADAAVAAAQKLADQFAEQGDNGTNGTNAAVAVNGNGAEVKAEPELEELAGNKRKLDESEADESARKKDKKSEDEKLRRSSTGPQKVGAEWSDTIEVAKNMVGKLIGKSGETIRNLQSNTGTRIQIDHQSPGEFKKVTITGATSENISGSLRQIESVLSDEPGVGDSNKTLDCPQGIVGRIIGRGGETIRALQQASQAHIIVDQNFPDGQDRKVILSGRPDAVDRASKMIDELIRGEPGSAQAIIQKYSAGINRVIDCPKGIVGRVIGKSGETIKQLQRTFGANIQIDQGTDPMKITIAGPAQSVDAAAGAVREIINGGNPYLGGPGGGAPIFGGPGGPTGGFGGPRGGGGFGGGPGGPSGFGGGPGGFGGGFPGFGGYPGMVPQQAAFGGFPGGFPQPYGAQSQGFSGFGAGFGGQDPYAASAGGAGAYGAGGGANAYAAPAASQWQELQDDQGRTYYYNTTTGTSQWEKPE